MKDLTAKEAAIKLGVTAGRVRQLVAEGRLPATKFGNVLVIKESDLKLVQERKRTGRPLKKKTQSKISKTTKTKKKSNQS